MHLKPYPNPQNESLVEGQRGLRVDQQGSLKPEWGLRQSCPLVASSGSGSANRCPFGVLSTNTLHCSSSSANTTTTNNNNKNLNSTWASKKGQGIPPVPAKVALTSSFLLLAAPTGLENEASLRIYQSEDGEGPLDIWAVIKPGNTKEKVAIFAGRQRRRSRDGGELEDAPPAEQEGPQDPRSICSLKSKNCWGHGGSLAKRRRMGKMGKTKGTDSQRPSNPGRPPPPIPLYETQPHTAGDSEEGTPQVEGEEGGRMVSVVEMVALLEQLANGGQHTDSKPVPLRNSTVTLPKSPAPLPEPKAVESVEEGLEEPESVRVLDMVARLESECLKRQSSRESGKLSRNNSLRRNVARVLLAGGSEPYQAPARPAETPADHQVDDQHLLEEPSAEENNQPKSQPESLTSPTPAEPPVLAERVEDTREAHLAQVECRVADTVKEAEPDVDRAQPAVPELSGTLEVEEPMPGMLFFRQSPPQALSERKTPQRTETTTPPKISISVASTTSPKPRDSSQSGGSSGILSESLQSPVVAKKALTLSAVIKGAGDDCSDHVTEGEGTEDKGEESDCTTSTALTTTAAFPLRRQVSHEFLEMRFKIQQLLEPQPYLAVLPHHVLVQIFALLPTHALAALKCTCLYFKSIIERYDVRPTDSRWVSEPRYRDDPCKQCKKQYRRGDVSLCRWHHKPYCQAMPYGPGYWICCRGAHKDTPGCNVGLHDNRWVPTFHRMNMSIYKNRESEEEA